MKPYYSGERKKWGLRSSGNRLSKHSPLARTVMVSDEQGKGYAYIQFDEAFIEAVGKAMPMGIGPQQPAYLRAVADLEGDGAWTIFGVAIGEGSGVPLVRYQTKPAWLDFVYRGTD